MVKPFPYYADFFHRREVFGDQRLELPLPIFHVSAANHKDERLPSLLREFGKIIVQIVAKLEVHVELHTGCRVPFAPGFFDSQRAD